jgi:hypothetical protein
MRWQHWALLVLLGANLLCADLWVATMTPVGVVSWTKVLLAFLVQTLSLSGVAVYCKGKWPSQAEYPTPTEALRRKAAPVILFVILNGFSLSLLQNGLQCGDQPLPTVRGKPVCGKE